MTMYQKTAVFILRLVGAVWTIWFAFIWGMYGVMVAFGLEVPHYPLHTILGNVGYVILGIFLVAVSKPLGRVIGKGLD
jgi:hypothetical protein